MDQFPDTATSSLRRRIEVAAAAIAERGPRSIVTAPSALRDPQSEQLATARLSERCAPLLERIWKRVATGNCPSRALAAPA